MELRKIGSLDVSVVGLGCNNFGRRVDEEGTRRVVDAALAEGVTFFDTADIYGGTKSEEFLGRVLQGRRERVTLATKFGMEVDPERKGARPEYVRQACEDSLRRLQTDRIDLYQLHTPDPSVPIADTLGALDELVKEGKVREIGCSNFSAAQLREAEATAPGARFVSVQNEYSLFRREPEAEVLPECARLDIAFIPYFPLASGLLTGKYRKGQEAPRGTRIEPGSDRLSEANLDRVERLIAVAEASGRTLLELAFSWLLARGEVASVIAGATRPEQVAANAAAVGWRLSEDELAAVDAALAA
ncbi:MAG: aldo/keto reductase [Fimbriimonas sp.]